MAAQQSYLPYSNNRCYLAAATAATTTKFNHQHPNSTTTTTTTTTSTTSTTDAHLVFTCILYTALLTMPYSLRRSTTTRPTEMPPTAWKNAVAASNACAARAVSKVRRKGFRRGGVLRLLAADVLRVGHNTRCPFRMGRETSMALRGNASKNQLTVADLKAKKLSISRGWGGAKHGTHSCRERQTCVSVPNGDLTWVGKRAFIPFIHILVLREALTRITRATFGLSPARQPQATPVKTRPQSLESCLEVPGLS